MNISPNSIAHVNIMNSVLHGNAPTEDFLRFSAFQEPSPLPSRAFVPLNGVSGSSHQEIEGGGDISKMNGVMDAASKKLRFYNQDPIRDPYAQISNSGFTPIGNLKTYGVANMYDRSEPTRLRDLPELYTVPYATTPFLGNNTTSIKYVDNDSTKLRYPVFQNKKSAITTTQVTIHPQQVFIQNPGVSEKLNNFYEQATTINLLGEDDHTFSTNLDPTKIKLGQRNFGLDSTRYINRWDIVDPSIVQNPDHIIMNVKNSEGGTISLFSCGISSRNELRNYVEINNC